MEWLAAALVFLGLLYFFPKAVGYSLLCILALGILGGAGIWAWTVWDSFEKDKVLSIVKLGEGSGCSDTHPMFIGFENRSGRVIEGVSFSLNFSRKGFSSSIGYLSYQTQDRILNPGDRYGLCYSIPESAASAPHSQLLVEVKSKEVNWKN